MELTPRTIMLGASPGMPEGLVTLTPVTRPCRDFTGSISAPRSISSIFTDAMLDETSLFEAVPYPTTTSSSICWLSSESTMFRTSLPAMGTSCPAKPKQDTSSTASGSTCMEKSPSRPVTAPSVGEPFTTRAAPTTGSPCESVTVPRTDSFCCAPARIAMQESSKTAINRFIKNVLD